MSAAGQAPSQVCMLSGTGPHLEGNFEVANVLCPVQRPRHAAGENLCCQLHPEQLQLAPGAMGLVTALTSIPIEAERHPLTIPGKKQSNVMTTSRDRSFPVDCMLRGSTRVLPTRGASRDITRDFAEI